jgi:hypothetical protein
LAAPWHQPVAPTKLDSLCEVPFVADKFVIIGPGLFELSNAGSGPYAVGGTKRQATVLSVPHRGQDGAAGGIKKGTKRNGISTLRMGSLNPIGPTRPNPTQPTWPKTWK